MTQFFVKSTFGSWDGRVITTAATPDAAQWYQIGKSRFDTAFTVVHGHRAKAWSKYRDEFYKEDFFYNFTTGETQWEPPPSFGGEKETFFRDVPAAELPLPTCMKCL